MSAFVRSRIGRTIWLVLVSPVVCTVVGCAMGATFVVVMLLVVRAVSPLEAARGLPLGMLYSLIYAGPVGLAGGVVGGLLASALGGGVLRAAARRAWVRAGSTSGAVVSLLGSAFFVMRGVGSGSLVAITFLTLVCVVAGATNGAIVALLGWREFGDRAANG